MLAMALIVFIVATVSSIVFVGICRSSKENLLAIFCFICFIAAFALLFTLYSEKTKDVSFNSPLTGAVVLIKFSSSLL